ncbi:hypothetical protein [Thermoflexibacter ruber]|uniref:Uncharacterized protein n=1 Tax=Thermoflexibacter ruber TaxID=1003 RepID=A0A1I2CKW4_9BACT|nr:hypothetical protein [Thermoflexibacter ruber]SFE68941.1 hypothetical protein SAMN04488541_100557 [Thermoflexibacter ruber]
MKIKSFLVVICLVLIANFSFAGTNVENSKIDLLAKSNKTAETPKAEKSKPKRCFNVTLSCGVVVTVCDPTLQPGEIAGLIMALERLNCRGRG